MSSLVDWIDRERAIAARNMLRAMSATGLDKPRPFFGQAMRPVPGSILASPVPAAYDPDPDYFFHWFRDSAVVIDALRLLHADGTLSDAVAITLLGDFVRFNLALVDVDGSALVRDPGWRDAVWPDYAKFIRDDDDLAAVQGLRVYAESRVNPDGTLDISRWNRPQLDGPPLTALALLRWDAHLEPQAALREPLARLIAAQFAVTRAHVLEPSWDMWEEELGDHYYVWRVAVAACRAGHDWFLDRGQPTAAADCATLADDLAGRLDGFWLEQDGYLASRRLASGERSTKELDIAVVLAAIHAGGVPGPHGVDDARVQATLDALDAHFETAYAINRDRPTGRGPALGRYPGDIYYSGGAYFFSQLGAAEFCYRAAAVADRDRWLARGDGYLEMARAYTPEDGSLAEQFDGNSGAPTSAKHLAWSYAALISCVDARRVLGA